MSLTPQQTGVDNRTFKEIKRVMLTTGKFDPELYDSLSSYQKYWVNETKKAYRDLDMS